MKSVSIGRVLGSTLALGLLFSSGAYAQGAGAGGGRGGFTEQGGEAIYKNVCRFISRVAPSGSCDGRTIVGCEDANFFNACKVLKESSGSPVIPSTSSFLMLSSL